ncbi:MAG: radical SAM protein [Desulfurococcaceae archaeon]
MVIRISDWVIALKDDSSPRTLVVEVSTKCNLSCLHCFRYSASNFSYRDMTLDEYVVIINNALRSGVKKVVLTGWGEPTVNPWILDMLSYAKSKNLYVVLNTNGLTMDKYLDELVKLSIDEVYVSVDAVDVELYDKLRRPSSLSVVTRNIKELSNLKTLYQTRKPVVKTIFTVTKLNVDQLVKLVDYAVDAGIQEVYLSLYIDHPWGLKNAECIKDATCLTRIRDIADTLSVKLMNTPLKLWLPNLESYTARECPFAANRALFVRVDGKVTPCLFLAYNWSIIIEDTKRAIREFVIGDALREDLCDIWRRNMNLYFKLFFNYMPSCLDCDLRKWCSYTLNTETDCWGNSPNCSFCPYHYKFSYCPL